ncbi:MAG: PBP1A family penicillin-binding protein [Lachnospiraceae bacterium]|nr:PBP1A family penicillin-binding protein [Lachnospiraceae bacterium]
MNENETEHEDKTENRTKASEFPECVRRSLKRLRNLPWKKLGTGLGVTLAALVLVFILIVWRLIAAAPDIDSIDVSPSASATWICDEEGNYLRRLSLSESNRDIVSLTEIPENLQNAIIAIEDSRFYEHGGIDLRGIARALWRGITSGSFSEGASTITQQLIKNNVFTDWTEENSFADRFARKVQEQYLAVQLEKQLSKEEILEDYLNTINFGAGCYGVEAAAQRYFGKDVSELTLSECAVLAAIPQNPTGYNPIDYPDANQTRQRLVLRYMEEQGYISHEERMAALSDDVYLRISTYNETWEADSVYSYYEDALIEQVTELLMSELNYSQDQAAQAVYSGGLRIYSAQDAALQEICDEEFADLSNFPEGTQYGVDDALTSQPQASLVLIEQETGFVRAIVGGRGEKTASLTLNRATGTTRQPGSTFKILTAYAPALDAAGQTLATLYENEPFEYEDGTAVSNWDVNDYSGTVTIREAITRSINVVAVRCITEITPRLGFTYAENLGISTLVDDRESSDGSTDVIQPLALGGITNGVTNLELCAAYASIANGGLYGEPLFFTKILDRNGNTLLDASGRSASVSTDTDPDEDSFGSFTRVLKASTAYLLTSAMEDVVSSADGTAYGTVSAAGQPVAGKTGTTSGYKDIWFVGYTPYYTCCVWGGYDNNQSLPSDSIGHSYSRVLWTSVMERVHTGLSIGEFTQPEEIVEVELCAESHLPAQDNCPSTYTEYFAEGTEPTETCSVHLPEPETETEDITESNTEYETETEKILIYQDILDQLLPESGTENESETERESESESKSETKNENDSSDENAIRNEVKNEEEIDDNGVNEKNAPEDLSDAEKNSEEKNSDSARNTDNSDSGSTEETSSLDDLLNRLAGQGAHLP